MPMRMKALRRGRSSVAYLDSVETRDEVEFDAYRSKSAKPFPRRAAWAGNPDASGDAFACPIGIHLYHARDSLIPARAVGQRTARSATSRMLQSAQLCNRRAPPSSLLLRQESFIFLRASRHGDNWGSQPEMAWPRLRDRCHPECTRRPCITKTSRLKLD